MSYRFIDSDYCDVTRKKICTDVDIEELTKEFERLNFSFDKWEVLAEMLRSNDITKRFEATKSIRILLSVNSDDIPIQGVIDVGAVPIFISFLSIGNVGANNIIGNNTCNYKYNYDDKSNKTIYESLMFEAAWALTNIASGTSIQTQAVVDNGGISKLLELLSLDIEEIREQGMWGLGNISGDRHQYRDLILETPNALQMLIGAIEKSKRVCSVRTGVWVMSNLCRGRPRPNFELVVPAFDFLRRTIIEFTDPEILSDALWALDGIGEHKEGIKIITSSFPLVKHLVSLLTHKLTIIQRPALRIIGQLVTGNTTETQCAIDAGVIYPLLQLIDVTSGHKKAIRKDACWALSNIAAGTKEQVQKMFESGAFDVLLGIFSSTDEEFSVKREAVWGICNALGGNLCQKASFVHMIVNENVVQLLCSMLDAVYDTKLLCVVLDALKNILKTGQLRASELGLNENLYKKLVQRHGGIQKISDLRVLPIDYSVNSKAVELLTFVSSIY